MVDLSNGFIMFCGGFVVFCSDLCSAFGSFFVYLFVCSVVFCSVLNQWFYRVVMGVYRHYI